MITVERLQAYIRRVVQQDREAVVAPPFTIFFHPSDDRPFFNYAIPEQEAQQSEQDLDVALARLRAAFAVRRRRPRFEFIEEFTPALVPVLRTHGFAEEARLCLMICTPATYRDAPDVDGLIVSVQDAH